MRRSVFSKERGTLNPRRHLWSSIPYPLGESTAPGVARVVQLASNELAVSPSPSVREAYMQAANQLNRYAEPTCGDLVEALAENHGLATDTIVCGNGSAELINRLVIGFLEPGDEIVTHRYGYLYYSSAARIMGAQVVRAESSAFVDAAALLRSVSSRTKVMFVDNPNNPTGACLSSDDLRRLRLELREDILLVIDAAYAEFVSDDRYDAGHSLVRDFDNVCVLRTFSKIYGLAGVRVGWAHCSPVLADLLKGLAQPAVVSRPAQIAAKASLLEKDRVAALRADNSELRSMLTKSLRRLGWKPFESQGNFVLVSFGGIREASEMLRTLKNKGILVRNMAAYGLTDCLRFTVGTRSDMEYVSQVISCLDSEFKS